MKQILECLIDQLIEQKEIESYSGEIEKFYDSEARHSYSEVSNFVYDCPKDKIDYLLENLNRIYSNLKEKGSLKALNVFKLIDHIRLESERETHIENEYFDKMKQLISINSNKDFVRIKGLQLRLDEKQRDIELELERKNNEMKEEFEKQTDSIDKINSNLISVLGIFGAIIVAFFGGLNLLGSVLANMHSVSSYRLVFLSIICLVGLFNIIFMLLYCISKLTGKYLWSNCKELEECKACNGQKNKVRCLYEKYPLVIIYNIVSFGIIVTIFFMYAVDKYNFITSLVGERKIPFLVVSVFFFIIFESILWISIYKTLKYLEKKYKCQRNNEQLTYNELSEVE
jgi:hypothetical protein